MGRASSILSVAFNCGSTSSNNFCISAYCIEFHRGIFVSLDAICLGGDFHQIIFLGCLYNIKIDGWCYDHTNE